MSLRFKTIIIIIILYNNIPQNLQKNKYLPQEQSLEITDMTEKTGEISVD